MKTKKLNTLKRLSAMVMAVAMCFALAVSASAAEAETGYTATAYAAGSTTTLSMADDAIDEDIAATITAVSGGYQVVIPLEPMSVYGYIGYIVDLDVDGATSVSVTAAPYSEGSATMSFVVDSLPSDLTFTIEFDVAIYTTAGVFYCNHSDFPNAPASISADIVLTAN